MTIRNTALILVLFAGLSMLLSGCQERTQIPASEMRRGIDRSSHSLMQGINQRDLDRARVHVSPEAEGKFNELLDGLREGRYDQMLISSDGIDIDFRRGRATVDVNYMKHQPGGRRELRNVGADTHLWIFEGGAWSWHGPLPRSG